MSMLEKYGVQHLDRIASAEQLIQLIDAGQPTILPLSLRERGWGEGGEAGWDEGKAHRQK